MRARRRCRTLIPLSPFPRPSRSIWSSTERGRRLAVVNYAAGSYPAPPRLVQEKRRPRLPLLHHVIEPHRRRPPRSSSSDAAATSPSIHSTPTTPGSPEPPTRLAVSRRAGCALPLSLWSPLAALPLPSVSSPPRWNSSQWLPAVQGQLGRWMCSRHSCVAAWPARSSKPSPCARICRTRAPAAAARRCSALLRPS